MASALETAILAETGIISYYPMADASAATATDKGPNSIVSSYDADCLLGAVGLNGKPGGAVKFAEVTGLGQKLSSTFNAKMVVTGSASHEFCIRLNHGGENNNAEIFNAHGFSGPQIHMVTVGSGLGFRLKKQSAEIMTTQTTSPITDTYKWHHVVITWDGTTAKIWLDGTEVQGATLTQTYAAGGVTGSTWGTEFLKATLCHGVFYEKALSAGQVATHYAAFQSEVAYPKGTTTFGIHNGFITTESKFWSNQIAVSRNIHSQVSRTDLRWDLVQTTEGAALNWTSYDEIFAKLAAAGIRKVVIPIVYSPNWANGGAAITNVPGNSAVAAAFTTWLGKFETFIKAAVTRYKKGGAGNPTGIDVYWEAWNEPNGITFWTNTELTPQPNAAMYGAFYKMCRAACKASDASAKVSFGTLTNYNNTGGTSITGKQFLRDVLATGSFTIDYASYHPYTQNFKNSPNDFASSTNYIDDTLNMYETLVANGYTSVKMILSEFGWSTVEVSEALQAEYTKITLERIRDYWSNFVELALIFRDYDKGVSLGLYKTMTEAGTPEAKSAAQIFSTFAGPFDIEESVGRVLI